MTEGVDVTGIGATDDVESGQPISQPRATGFCSMCDSWFVNQPALAWPDSRVAGGWIYAEQRHMTTSAPTAERVLSAPDAHVPPQR